MEVKNEQKFHNFKVSYIHWLKFSLIKIFICQNFLSVLIFVGFDFRRS